MLPVDRDGESFKRSTVTSKTYTALTPPPKTVCRQIQSTPICRSSLDKVLTFIYLNVTEQGHSLGKAKQNKKPSRPSLADTRLFLKGELVWE